jgi:diadenosine tetraphosphate (Ap4A) HIT family hydrolase
MWWADFKEMFDHIEQLPENYNITLNIGHAAGQTVKHLHFWIVPRSEEGPAAGKGLATLARDFTAAE